MDFFSTGIQQIGRRFRRRRLRRLISSERRRLARSETDLGRAAWPDVADACAADPEISATVARLRDLDREIAALASGAQALTIQAAVASAADAQVQERVLEALGDAHSERSSIRVQENRLRTETDSIPVDALVVQGETPLRTLHSRRQEIERRVESIHEERRQASAVADEKRAETRGKLEPVQRDLARIEAARNQPLRELGRFLATRPDLVPASAARALATVHAHRQRITSHTEREEALLRLSRAADQQSERLTIFVLTTFAALAALALLVTFRAPPRRDWLPNDTQLIASANLQKLLTIGASSSTSPWNGVWRSGLKPLSELPVFAESIGDVRRLTRATGVEQDGAVVDYLLIETDAPAGVVTSQLTQRHGFGQRYDSVHLGGLPIYERSTQLACAQIGPQTLTFGNSAAVSKLIRVRLGLELDLKIDEAFFGHYRQLERSSGFSLVTGRPADLVGTAGDPAFSPELTGACQLLGVAAYPGDLVTLVVLARAENPERAARLAVLFANAVPRFLRLEDNTAFDGTPQIQQNENEVECRVRLPEPVARTMLERLASARLAPR